MTPLDFWMRQSVIAIAAICFGVWQQSFIATMALYYTIVAITWREEPLNCAKEIHGLIGKEST